LPAAFAEVDQALLSDPQTSGGLLVSCSADSAAEVLAIFHAQGFADAAVIGEVSSGHGVSIY
jgi:selenide, water dikinase